MEIFGVVILFGICLIIINKKINEVRNESTLNNARYNDLLKHISSKLEDLDKMANDCIKGTEDVKKLAKKVTAELKILNFMNSKTVDLKGEVSQDFMNMLKKSKVKPKLRIITTKKEKKNDSNNRKRT